MKPISKTAFYCCGVRMQDAERSNPVCNDIYAKTFMNEDGLKTLEAFKDETRTNTRVFPCSLCLCVLCVKCMSRYD